MGWYINYEIQFDDDEYIDWDDVKRSLKHFNVDYLYLRDLDKPLLMLCIYSQYPIKEILLTLKKLNFTNMSYRIYNSNDTFIPFI